MGMACGESDMYFGTVVGKWGGIWVTVAFRNGFPGTLPCPCPVGTHSCEGISVQNRRACGRISVPASRLAPQPMQPLGARVCALSTTA